MPLVLTLSRELVRVLENGVELLRCTETVFVVKGSFPFWRSAELAHTWADWEPTMRENDIGQLNEIDRVV